MKKLLFFDIDGTLVDFGNSTMSPSTADALINAKQNGHMIFLCTGRSYNQIYPSLKAFDFELENEIYAPFSELWLLSISRFACPTYKSKLRGLVAILNFSISSELTVFPSINIGSA